MGDTKIKVIPTHRHAWRVAPFLLADEPARRQFIKIVRRESPTGRVVFRKRDPHPQAFTAGLTESVYTIEVLRCTTEHEEDTHG